MQVIILGNNSAIPAHGRHPTAQLIKVLNTSILIDCGEGTQMQIAKFKLKPSRLRYILISHLHGDHFFGLPGLLTSLNLLGHQQTIQIFSPPGLEQIIQAILDAGNTTLNYSLEFITLSPGFKSFIAEPNLKISSFPLTHRIPTWGFKIEESFSERNIIPEFIEQYALTFEEIKMLKKGHPVNRPDEVIMASDVTKPLKPAKQYAYCSDTCYDQSIITSIAGVDLLYHEATFMHDQLIKAQKTMHTTAKQAGALAKEAAVKKLLLGHYSSRYDDLEPLVLEAREIFKESYLSIEGETYSI